MEIPIVSFDAEGLDPESFNRWLRLECLKMSQGEAPWPSEDMKKAERYYNWITTNQ